MRVADQQVACVTSASAHVRVRGIGYSSRSLSGTMRIDDEQRTCAAPLITRLDHSRKE